MRVTLDTKRITDWNTFHDVFADTFGFPNFYGRNRDAWIDCMSDLDAPENGMTSIHVSPGETAVLQLENVDEFARRCPEQYAALNEDAAFVNWRSVHLGKPALIALAFFKSIDHNGSEGMKP